MLYRELNRRWRLRPRRRRAITPSLLVVAVPRHIVWAVEPFRQRMPWARRVRRRLRMATDVLPT